MPKNLRRLAKLALIGITLATTVSMPAWGDDGDLKGSKRQWSSPSDNIAKKQGTENQGTENQGTENQGTEKQDLLSDGRAGNTSSTATKGQIDFTVFEDLAAFTIAAQGPLTRESFEEGRVAAGELLVCSDPYDSNTNDACWDPGDIADRLQVSSSGGNGVILLGPGIADNDTIVTGADAFADNTLLSFSEGGIFALSVDLSSNQQETLELRLLDSKDIVVGISFFEASSQAQFWGVVAEQPFSRLVIVSANGELVDNVRFGPPPPRIDARFNSFDQCLDPVTNVNDIWEPGEGIGLQVTLTAVGSDFHNVFATFSSPDDTVSSLLPSVGFGDLLQGESRTRPIILELAPDLACFSSLQLDLEAISLEDTFRFDRLQDIGRQPIAQDIPLDLSDNSPQGVDSFLQVNDPGVLDNVDVRVEIEHPWVGDLEILLTSPAGTTVRLLDRPGVPSDTFGCSRNNMDVVFSDSASEELEDLCLGNPWFIGTGLPTEPLAVLAGESLAGTWRLRVIDHAPGDGGRLVHWRLLSDPSLEGECTPCNNSGVQLAPTDIPTLGRSGGYAMAALLVLLGAIQLRRRG